MSGFSRALAVGIMEAWKAGASMKRLSDDLLKELDEKVREGAYVHEMDARTFTATFSRYANECLWDGRFNSAINWLIHIEQLSKYLEAMQKEFCARVRLEFPQEQA